MSRRCYLRLELAGGATAVLAVYPPEQSDVCRRFLATARLLAAAGVRVPRVLASDCDRGWTVVEDLGERTLHEWAEGRGWDDLAPRYLRVVPAMHRIAALPRPAIAPLSPPLDRDLLGRELEQTWETFLEPEGLTGGPGDAAALRRALEELCAAVAAVPPVPCHRDLTPRNLVPLADGGVGILDHQDLRLGPPLYDLASLLNDTLFPPPEIEAAVRTEWGMEGAVRVEYHRVAAQRTLKAVGSYAAAARQGNRRRLDLVAPTLRRALEHLSQAPETSGLAAALGERWRPALAEVQPAGGGPRSVG